MFMSVDGMSICRPAIQRVIVLLRENRAGGVGDDAVFDVLCSLSQYLFLNRHPVKGWLSVPLPPYGRFASEATGSRAGASTTTMSTVLGLLVRIGRAGSLTFLQFIQCVTSGFVGVDFGTQCGKGKGLSTGAGTIIENGGSFGDVGTQAFDEVLTGCICTSNFPWVYSASNVRSPFDSQSMFCVGDR